MQSDAKIEQFVLLASSARGLALVDLIKRATSEPGLFAFGELFDIPGIREVWSCASNICSVQPSTTANWQHAKQPTTPSYLLQRPLQSTTELRERERLWVAILHPTHALPRHVLLCRNRQSVLQRARCCDSVGQRVAMCTRSAVC